MKFSFDGCFTATILSYLVLPKISDILLLSLNCIFSPHALLILLFFFSFNSQKFVNFFSTSWYFPFAQLNATNIIFSFSNSNILILSPLTLLFLKICLNLQLKSYKILTIFLETLSLKYLVVRLYVRFLCSGADLCRIILIQ